MEFKTEYILLAGVAAYFLFMRKSSPVAPIKQNLEPYLLPSSTIDRAHITGSSALPIIPQTSQGTVVTPAAPLIITIPEGPTGTDVLKLPPAALPAGGQPLPYFQYIVISMNPGEERVFTVNVDKPLIYLNFGISGLFYEASASFTWIFPDGRTFPQSGNQGRSQVTGMDGGGVLMLRTQKYISPNFGEDYIPTGTHTIVIRSNSTGNFKLGIYNAE